MIRASASWSFLIAKLWGNTTTLNIKCWFLAVSFGCIWLFMVFLCFSQQCCICTVASKELSSTEPSSEPGSEEHKSSRGHSEAFCYLCKQLHDGCQHSLTDIMVTKMLKFHFSFSCGSLDFAFVILAQMCWHDGLQWAVRHLVLAVGLNGQIFLLGYPC